MMQTNYSAAGLPQPATTCECGCHDEFDLVYYNLLDTPPRPIPRKLAVVQNRTPARGGVPFDDTIEALTACTRCRHDHDTPSTVKRAPFTPLDG